MNNSTKFRVFIPLLLAFICSGLSSVEAQTIVTFETNLGDIKIELLDDTRPISGHGSQLVTFKKSLVKPDSILDKKSRKIPHQPIHYGQ